MAALSAEPETIEELAAALTRFAGPNDSQLTDGWRSGTCCEPYNAGIAIVDLAARLVAAESTYGDPIPAGEFLYRDADRDLEVWLPYHVADDWQFIRGTESWEGLVASRRQQRQAAPQIDARGVLYGQVARSWPTSAWQRAGRCLPGQRVRPRSARCAAVPANGDSSPIAEWTPPAGWSFRRCRSG